MSLSEKLTIYSITKKFAERYIGDRWTLIKTTPHSLYLLLSLYIFVRCTMHRLIIHFYPKKKRVISFLFFFFIFVFIFSFIFCAHCRSFVFSFLIQIIQSLIIYWSSNKFCDSFNLRNAKGKCVFTTTVIVIIITANHVRPPQYFCIESCVLYIYVCF